eukprot:5317710-Amphidinium_carterae.1
MKKEVDTLTDYYPVWPVELMAKVCPYSNDNRYTPIVWNPDFVEPPYEDFYKDGSRCVPKLDKMTGYETIPAHFPVVFEEY